MNSLTDFIQNTLYPALFPRVDVAFQSLHLSQYRGGWKTSYKLDGTQTSRPDKSVITRSHPTRILEQGGESKDLLTLWMEQGHYNSTFEAVEALCKQIGITPPERQSSEEWEKFCREQERRELLLSKMRKALSDPEQGAATLNYLREKRGYKEDYISKLMEWGIGCITPEIATEMGDALPRSLQIDKHQLALPYYSGGRLYGFIFRDITGTLGGGGKYRFSYGLTKKAHLFGLTGLNLTGNRKIDRTLTIVEGQMDALHAQLEGLENVAATGGVALSVEALLEAKARGVERVVLILDSEGDTAKDKQRDADRAKALRTINSVGLEGFIAILPTEEGSKTDVDSYLNAHPITELEATIETAESAPLFLYRLLEDEALAKYNAQKQQEVWAEQNISDFRKAVLSLLTEPIARPTDRDRIYSAVSEFSQGAITRESIKEEAEAIRKAEDLRKHKEETQKVTEQASTLAKAGRAEEAMELLSKELPRLSQMKRETEFSKLLSTQTEAEFREEMQRKKEGLPTAYTFEKNGKRESFLLPSGAITLICAPTSHGKSTLLQNLALQTAQDGREGAVLYFTFEEEASSIKLQMLNKYLNIEITRQWREGESNNLRTLTEYYRTGSTQYVRGESLQALQDGERKFFSLITSGAIRIYRENWDAAKLQEAIRYLCKQIKVKAVFIDYIQLLRLRNFKGERRMELCDICDLFNNLAIDTAIPIVMGAQLNRDAASPLEMHAQNIAESADIERYANTILTLWNSSFTETTRSKAEKKELETLQTRLNFTLGTGGKIYVKITKNRGGVVGLEGVMDYNGNTGVMSQNLFPFEPPTTAPTQNGIF